MRVHQQAAYVLLNRPYSETSFIVEVFSKKYGRLGLMAKGARRLKSPFKGLLLPFQPLLLSWTGKGEVPTLTSAEIQLDEFNLFEHELTGDALVCGFYCNELLVNLLHRHDPHAQLFQIYHRTILNLYKAPPNDDAVLASELREFECALIKEAGYGVNFTHESDYKTPIDPNGLYLFQRGQGFVRSELANNRAVKGSVILSLDDTNSATADVLRDNKVFTKADAQSGKVLMRDILQQTLGHRPLKSRELFFPKSR